MDPSWLALVAFLIVSVAVAAIMLWPRFRESVSVEDPVVPDVVDRLRLGLEQEGCCPELAEALQQDPYRVRKDREQWSARLVQAGASEDLQRALLDV